MNSNNIELKWRQEELIFLHGDLIEFECKQGYNFLQTTIPSPGRTQCNDGRLKYPKCIMQGKTILFLIAFLINQSQTYLETICFGSAGLESVVNNRWLGFNSTDMHRYPCTRQLYCSTYPSMEKQCTFL